MVFVSHGLLHHQSFATHLLYMYILCHVGIEVAPLELCTSRKASYMSVKRYRYTVEIQVREGFSGSRHGEKIENRTADPCHVYL